VSTTFTFVNGCYFTSNVIDCRHRGPKRKLLAVHRAPSL